ncbi:hypothetical protein V5738_10835 [Salinisphaera sp. SPP-AMP-43]|uniref:hypothetical protein n=1 Tax=Salinisphaera sp. SPP-AMP-43 TaxID=3121288 RepID=UPI003C6DED53
MTQAVRCDFQKLDPVYRPESTESQTITVPDKPHVLAIQSISTNTTFAPQPTTGRGSNGEYRYYVRPTDNIESSCRVFVFTGFDATADEEYGLRISGGSRPAFVSSRPYMRVAGQFSINAGDGYGSHTMSDGSREYAAAIMSFSCETRQMQGQLPGNEGVYYYDASLCRGVQTNGATIDIASDVVSLVGSGTDVDTGRFEQTSVLVIDVTDLY